MFVKEGRFGPYVQLGVLDESEKAKNASLLKGMTVEDVSLDVALKLLSLPRTLGEDPKTNAPVEAFNGRFGPYVKCGDETRSLPAEMSPIEVTLEQALELLAQPKTRRGRGAPKEPMKVFDESPVTGEPIKMLDGRFGPYVTDGTTNASLPKGTDVESVTFDVAVQLLADRAGPRTEQEEEESHQKEGGKEEDRQINDSEKEIFEKEVDQQKEGRHEEKNVLIGILPAPMPRRLSVAGRRMKPGDSRGQFRCHFARRRQ